MYFGLSGVTNILLVTSSSFQRVTMQATLEQVGHKLSTQLIHSYILNQASMVLLLALGGRF